MKHKTGEKHYTQPLVLSALLASAIIIATIGLGLAGTFQTESGSLFGPTAFQIAGVCIAFAYCIAWVASACSPINVSSEGLRSYTAVGVYKTAPWNEITSIEAVSILGLRYARIKAHGDAPAIWVPAWLKARSAFIESVRAHSTRADALEAALEWKPQESARRTGTFILREQKA